MTQDEFNEEVARAQHELNAFLDAAYQYFDLRALAVALARATKEAVEWSSVIEEDENE